VEVLVSAILILLMIMGATAAMRKGQQVSALDRQRNQVRQELISELERAKYLQINFDSLKVAQSDTVLVLEDRGTSQTSDDLNANLHITVESLTATLTPAVPYKKVSLKATWTSLDGPDTLQLEKWICDLIL
jgi:hypothetical protein